LFFHFPDKPERCIQVSLRSIICAPHRQSRPAFPRGKRDSHPPAAALPGTQATSDEANRPIQPGRMCPSKPRPFLWVAEIGPVLHEEESTHLFRGQSHTDQVGLFEEVTRRAAGNRSRWFRPKGDRDTYMRAPRAFGRSGKRFDELLWFFQMLNGLTAAVLHIGQMFAQEPHSKLVRAQHFAD
jgi:hypothetical protein